MGVGATCETGRNELKWVGRGLCTPLSLGGPREYSPFGLNIAKTGATQLYGVFGL